MWKAVAHLLFYPTLFWNLLLYRFLPARRWWDRVDETVLIGALPWERDVSALWAEGVRAVVNTCAEYPGPVEEYARLGIVQLHLPIVDFTSPSVEDLERSVAFMREQAVRGSVYVHCKAGRGRSATVVLAWLIAHGMRPEAAQALLLEKRPHVMPWVHERPAVQEFARRQGPPSQ